MVPKLIIRALLALAILAAPAAAPAQIIGGGIYGARAAGGGGGSSTWDFVTNYDNTPGVASSNGALTATKTGAEGASYIIGTQAISGVIYWEVTINNDPTNNNFSAKLLRAGIAHTLAICAHPRTSLGADSCSVGVTTLTDSGTTHPGPIYINFSTVNDWNVTFANGSHLGFVVNTTTKKLWVTNDGSHWYGASGGAGTDDPCTPTGGLNITAILADGPVYPALSVFTTAGGPSADQATYNPVSSSFTFTKPSCATAIG